MPGTIGSQINRIHLVPFHTPRLISDTVHISRRTEHVRMKSMFVKSTIHKS